MYLLTAIIIALIVVIFVMFLRIYALRNEAAFWFYRANKYRRMEKYLARRQAVKIAYKKLFHTNDCVCDCTPVTTKVKYHANNNGI